MQFFVSPVKFSQTDIQQLYPKLTMWPLSARHSDSPYKISPKSDNRSMNYDQTSDFQDGGCRHLEFQKNSFFGHVTVTGFNI